MPSLLSRLLDLLRRRTPATPQPPTPPTPRPIDPSLLDALNAARTGLPPLADDPQLGGVAQRHAEWMAGTENLSHFGDGSLGERVAAGGYHFSRCAENIAEGQKTPSETVDAWMSSPPHRLNLTGPYADAGTGRAASHDGTIYWCAIFATRGD